MKKNIYIAGKVTGLDSMEVRLKFKRAEEEVIARGFEAINPINLVNNPNATWEEAMKKCIAALCLCDAVYLLPCCNTSPGAKLEIAIAASLKIPAFQKVDDLYQVINLE
jgi:hypothetical protein